MKAVPMTSKDTPAKAHDSVLAYCTFRLGEDLFGIDTHLVKEVTALPPLTPIPHVPPAVRGYVNLRGQIVLVLDLNCLLGRNLIQIGGDTRLVVFRPALGDPFGVLVDRIADIVVLHTDQMEDHTSGMRTIATGDDAPTDEELITGIGKLDRELLSILDARKLLPCIERVMRKILR